MTQAVAQGELYQAGQHDEHPGRRLAGREKTFATGITPWRGKPPDARDVVVGQFGKQLLATILEALRNCLRCHVGRSDWAFEVAIVTMQRA